MTMRYSIEPIDLIDAKGYGFLSFAKDTGKNLNSKYRQTILDSRKQSATYILKTASKRAIKKTEEATGDLIANKIVEKSTGLGSQSTACKTCTNSGSADYYN